MCAPLRGRRLQILAGLGLSFPRVQLDPSSPVFCVILETHLPTSTAFDLALASLGTLR